MLTALGGAGLTADLARCPVPGTAGGTNWYRLKGAGVNPGILSVQTSCNGRPCEGFALSQGEELPALQPAQVKLYSEQCSAPPADRKLLERLLANSTATPVRWAQRPVRPQNDE